MQLYEIGENSVLGSVFEIEELLESISSLQHKVSHYENLKKHRANILDEKISKIEDTIKIYRKVILETMKEKAPDEKTLDFAPLGKVTRKKSNDLWCVDDEKIMIGFMEKKELKDKVVEMKEKVVKKKLDIVLNELNKKGVEVPGTHLQRGEENVSIVFDKAHKPKKEEIETVDSPQEVCENIEI